MISVYIKLFKIYFLVIIFLSSCEYNSISDFDKDIEELIDWSLINETKYLSINYTPISSETLAELISLEEYSNLVQPKNGVLIGYLIFKNDKIFLSNEQWKKYKTKVIELVGHCNPYRPKDNLYISLTHSIIEDWVYTKVAPVYWKEVEKKKLSEEEKALQKKKLSIDNTGLQ